VGVGDVVGESPSEVERFHATSGRVTGVIGLVVIGVVVLLPVLDSDVRHPLWLWPACGLAAVLLWCAMLRPRVWVEPGRLVLRNMLDTVRVPLAAVGQVSVRQFLAVAVGERRYVGTGVSRSRRQGFRDDRNKSGQPEDLSYGAWVENRLWELTDTARRDAGLKAGSEEQAALAQDVRREPAWPEIALIALFAVLLVLAVAL
jgi:hypothetical protein